MNRRRIASARDWVRQMGQRMDKAGLGTIAASVAFFGFLSIFPALAAVIALWGVFFDPAIIRSQMDLVAEFLPAEAFSLINTQVEALIRAGGARLGWASVLSLLFALWSARAGVAALVEGVNRIHHLPSRSGPRHLLMAGLLTLALIAIALSALLAAVVVPVGLAFLPLGPSAALVLELANTALAVALVALGLGLIYRFSPNRPRAGRPRLLTRGLLLAVILWIVVARGFVFYLANFGNYNQVYGSIGAVVALMMWLYLSAYAILLGVAIDAQNDPSN